MAPPMQQRSGAGFNHGDRPATPSFARPTVGQSSQAPALLGALGAQKPRSTSLFKAPTVHSVSACSVASNTSVIVAPRRYAVMYTKDRHKKSKSWNDGFLEQAGRKYYLFDAEGKKKRETHGAEYALTEGQTLDIGTFILEVTSLVPTAEWNSERAFLATGAPQLSVPAASSFSSNSNSFKHVGFNSGLNVTHSSSNRPTLPREPLHSADAPSAVVLSKHGTLKGVVVVDPVLGRKLRPHRNGGKIRMVISGVATSKNHIEL